MFLDSKLDGGVLVVFSVLLVACASFCSSS